MSGEGRNDRLRDLLASAADRLGVDLAGPAVFGLDARTVGARATSPQGLRWLRVATEPQAWAGGPAWEGNQAANEIAGVAELQVRDVVEWDEGDRRVRAELQTLAPGHAVSETMALRDCPGLENTCWEELQSALQALADHPTKRICLDEPFVRRLLLAFFGATPDLQDVIWTTAHGDLHWANLMAPECWILDWEAWGTAPAGYDAALL